MFHLNVYFILFMENRHYYKTTRESAPSHQHAHCHTICCKATLHVFGKNQGTCLKDITMSLL